MLLVASSNTLSTVLYIHKILMCRNSKRCLVSGAEEIKIEMCILSDCLVS